MSVMRIQKLRTDAGITQAILGRQMGVAQCVVSEWESEVYLPKARDLPRLAKVLGCQVNDLFNLDEYQDSTSEE